MADVSFMKGLLANLPAEKTPGRFYVTTDEGALYLDIGENERLRFPPKASADQVGGVKVGDGLSVLDGVLSVDPSIPTDDEMMQAMIETDTLSAVSDGGMVLTDESGNVLLM